MIRDISLLYHYTKLTTALEHILLEGQIRFSPLTRMRDPRESQHWLPSHAAVAGRDWAAGEFEQLHEELQAARARIKVFSVTETLPGTDPDGLDEAGFGYGHPRLWETYAEDHRGVCIVFDRAALLEQLAEQHEVFSGSMEYTNDELIPGVNTRTIEDHGIKGAVDYLLERRRRELVFRKTKDWQTEVEFRIATVADHGDYVHARVLESIRSVIIGVKMARVYLPSLRALCNPPGISVQQIFWQNGLPWLIGGAPAFPPDPEAPPTIHVKARLRTGDPEEW